MKGIIALFLCVFSISLAAQKLKTVSGNYDFLKDQTEINVVLTFDNVLITTDNLNEEQFLASHKKTFLSKEDKTEADWQSWSEGWKNYKANSFADEFLNGLAKTKKIKFGKDLNTKYTLVVDAKWFYPGWYGGFVFQPAKVSADLKFVETGSPSNIMLEIAADKIEGSGSGKKEDLAMEYGRISKAYEKLGKTLFKQLNVSVR